MTHKICRGICDSCCGVDYSILACKDARELLACASKLASFGAVSPSQLIPRTWLCLTSLWIFSGSLTFLSQPVATAAALRSRRSVGQVASDAKLSMTNSRHARTRGTVSSTSARVGARTRNLYEDGKPVSKNVVVDVSLTPSSHSQG